MLHKIWSRSLLGFMLMALFGLAVAAVNVPLAAQGAFATNTPDGGVPGPAVFATNTPFGLMPTATQDTTTPPTPIGPPLSSFNFSLRLWLEQDLINIARDQIRELANGNAKAERALQLTLYELERRFPGAPRSTTQRLELIQTMLEAPPGSIDMRSMVRPFVEGALNSMAEAQSFMIEGFQVDVMPANLDNRGAEDVVVHIRFVEDDGTLRYDDYVLALRIPVGFEFLPNDFDLFAAPFGGVHAIVLRRIDDVNRDALDEVVLRVDDDAINDRLYILGFRNGLAIDLAAPGQEIRFTELVNWPVDNPDEREPVLTVITTQAESMAPNWPCFSQRSLDWSYDRNFYRVLSDLNRRFETTDSLGCTLHNAEPLFAQSTSAGIRLLENALLQYGFEADGAERALMTLAMFYTLSGRLDDARNTATSLQANNDEKSWVSQQANALLRALGSAGNTAVDICQIVAQANQDPACDIDAVLGRLLESLDLNTQMDLVEQLELFDLQVAQSVLVSEVGMADRTVLRFDMPGTGWWSFLAQRDGTYRVEPGEPPAGVEQTNNASRPQVAVPDAAYDALFMDNNPLAALNIVSNLRTENPNRPLSAAAAYLEALSFDLTANREDARLAYFDTWSRYPDSLWGELAAQHLERR